MGAARPPVTARKPLSDAFQGHDRPEAIDNAPVPESAAKVRCQVSGFQITRSPALQIRAPTPRYHALMRTVLACVVLLLLGCPALTAFGRVGFQQTDHPEIPRISADALVSALKSSNKPLVLQVGMARLYRHSHIAGADYAGPANEPEGLAALRKRVASVPKTAAIVIYCGCCPWEHCPNIKPAYDELHNLGFRNVKALYLPNNFKFDWEDKGYPTASGE